MDQFEGKFAVVTGAGSGIGRALAMRCAEEGMRVAVADVHAGRLETLRAALEKEGADVLTGVLDVSEAQAFEGFARRCHDDMGVPDLLFNNAGILRVGETWSHASSDWQTLLSVNVMGVVNGLNAFVPSMLKAKAPGHIVNTGSVGSLVAAPAMAQYTAAKMAVRGITECLALDFAARDAEIGVSLLCPGPVLTSISDDLLGIAPEDEVVGPEQHQMAGQPDFISPDDCAEHVFRAIRERRFWVFTHPFNHHLSGLTQAIIEGKNPVYREVEFDANR